MSHQIIKDTMHLDPEDVMDMLSIGDVGSIISKRNRMLEFLKYNKWDVSEYKKWIKSGKWTPDKRSRGLGDTIAKATNKIGIKACGGCKSRQKTLNKLVKYKVK